MLGGGGGALGADALRLLQRRSTGSGPFSILCYLHKLCGKDWTLVFSKVDRRNNRMVDRLAKLASTVSLDVVTFDEPLSEVVFDIGFAMLISAINKSSSSRKDL
ncbi:hypothetical protein V6N12_041916 [Hibiscus sabdariffa]|uniref:RNase H type-1 domain-containing protein n=1 Tax=Hibiscus sabdariffa TaxID=183260 RepID=A0ABR2EDN4_9ROSI